MLTPTVTTAEAIDALRELRTTRARTLTPSCAAYEYRIWLTAAGWQRATGSPERWRSPNPDDTTSYTRAAAVTAALTSHPDTP